MNSLGSPDISRSDLLGDRLADRRQRAVQDCVKSLPGRIILLPYLYFCGCAGRQTAWLEAMTATGNPPRLRLQGAFVSLPCDRVGGTTIAPWMQFYLQASCGEGVTRRQYNASKLDVVVGCVFTDVVAWFIIVACRGHTLRPAAIAIS